MSCIDKSEGRKGKHGEMIVFTIHQPSKESVTNIDSQLIGKPRLQVFLLRLFEAPAVL